VSVGASSDIGRKEGRGVYGGLSVGVDWLFDDGLFQDRLSYGRPPGAASLFSWVLSCWLRPRERIGGEPAYVAYWGEVGRVAAQVHVSCDGKNGRLFSGVRLSSSSHFLRKVGHRRLQLA